MIDRGSAMWAVAALLCFQARGRENDPALAPPRIITAPGPEYGDGAVNDYSLIEDGVGDGRRSEEAYGVIGTGALNSEVPR